MPQLLHRIQPSHRIARWSRGRARVAAVQGHALRLVALMALMALAAAPRAQPVPPGASSAPAPAARGDDARIVGASALGLCVRRAPAYPPQALREELQGRSVVAFSVSASGVPEAPAVLQSSGHRLLDQAALQHLARCIEAHAHAPGGPLPPGRFSVPVLWRLE
jgi:TonB family protein